MEDVEQYLYFTISPMLKVHGLMENEKVTGAKYRRYVITETGTRLLAYIEKNELKKAKEKKKELEKQ